MLFYIGGRTSPDIVQWLQKKTGPPCLTLTDVAAAKAFVEKDEVVVIGFFEVIQFVCESCHLSLKQGVILNVY